MVMTKVEGLLHFDTDYEFATQECLLGEGFVEGQRNRLF